MRYPGGRRFQAAVSRVNAQILGFADAHVGLSRPPQPGNGWETQRVTPFAQGHNRRQRSFPLKAPRFGQLDGLKTAVRNLPLCGVYHAGSIQHGRHHRADLPGLAVHGPAAAEDQIKPAQRRLGLCQTAGRHQRVRAREPGRGHQHGFVRAPGQGLPQHPFGPSGAHGQAGHGSAVLLLQFQPQLQRAFVRRIEHLRHKLPFQRQIAGELHFRGVGHLL